MKRQLTFTNYNKKRRSIACYVILGVLLILLFILSVCIGSINISFSQLLDVFTGNGDDATYATILFDIRMPRTLAAILLGGSLALSGYLLQTFFQNPIAGPFVLGISSGAKLVVALTMIIFLKNARLIQSFELILAAFTGSLISMGAVLLVSRKVRNMSVLVLTGVMIGYICSAITDLVVTFADDTDIVNLHNWSLGSFSGISWKNVDTMFWVILISFLFVFALSKPMNAYQMGETYAANLGVNIRLFRAMLVILSSILSACVTAFAGPVSFVGIAVPQIMKKMFHSSKPILLIPACFLGGAVYCMFCDLLARTLFAPTELSISTVTAIFGAPIVIAVMIRQQRRKIMSE